MEKAFRIIRDSREKDGWFFSEEEKKYGKFQCVGTNVLGLKSGDYSIEINGKVLDDLIVVERKAGFQELFGNMIPASNKERFERECERLRDVKYKYLVIETSLTDDLWSLSVPQFKFGPPCSKVFEWIIELQQEYGIIPIFAGQCGQKVVRKIFEKFLQKYKNEF